jgi:hypothetical protein
MARFLSSGFNPATKLCWTPGNGADYYCINPTSCPGQDPDLGLHLIVIIFAHSVLNFSVHSQQILALTVDQQTIALVVMGSLYAMLNSAPTNASV